MHPPSAVQKKENARKTGRQEKQEKQSRKRQEKTVKPEKAGAAVPRS